MAILIRTYDVSSGQIVSKFLAMPICNIGTAEKLFDTIDATMK